MSIIIETEFNILILKICQKFVIEMSGKIMAKYFQSYRKVTGNLPPLRTIVKRSGTNQTDSSESGLQFAGQNYCVLQH